MTSDPRIHVLLPVHNRKATTEKFIRCLLAQADADWHLVLIDDGSTDGTGAMVEHLVPSATILRGEGNWWWGGALQQGYEWLKREKPPASDLVLIINDDTVFEKDFLANGARAVEPRSLVLARLYDQATEKFVESGVYWDWRELSCTPVSGNEEINCFSTRGLFLRAGDFMEIGGFHPVLLPHYLSDYEFTIRAHRKGFALLSRPEVALSYDETLTGIRKIEGRSFLKTLRLTFSIKSAGNPLYWTSFILLACPHRYVVRNVFRVWARLFSPVTSRIRIFLAPVRRVLGRVKRRILRLLGAGPRPDGPESHHAL